MTRPAVGHSKRSAKCPKATLSDDEPKNITNTAMFSDDDPKNINQKLTEFDDEDGKVNDQ